MLNNRRLYIYISIYLNLLTKLQNKSSHFGVLLTFIYICISFDKIARNPPIFLRSLVDISEEHFPVFWQEPVDLNFFSFFAHLLVIFASSLLAWDGMIGWWWWWTHGIHRQKKVYHGFMVDTTTINHQESWGKLLVYRKSGLEKIIESMDFSENQLQQIQTYCANTSQGMTRIHLKSQVISGKEKSFKFNRQTSPDHHRLEAPDDPSNRFFFVFNIGKKMDPSEVKLILLAIGKQLMWVKAKIPSSSVPHLHNLNTLTYVICWPVQKMLLEIGISIYCVYCICLVYKYCNLQEDRKSESYWTSGIFFFLGLMYYIITMNQPKKCMQEILAWPVPGFHPGAYLDWRQGRQGGFWEVSGWCFWMELPRFIESWVKTVVFKIKFYKPKIGSMFTPKPKI